MAFYLGNTRQRPLMGGAVNTVAGRAHDPLQQLAVGVGDVPEVPQGRKLLLMYLTPDSTIPFFWGSRGGQGEMRKP